ncbi:hypothetical protein SteCoe_2396 [Stentor coeruleus]|uniref:Chromosome segregation in meiosis protein 3 domain-containing protein n=1 Tax=Stentor coeruleus TaxID=5963 RepID=A0A1R2CZR3_9CILI|nr:hypothetical protein SteCoe_2396 [Stentor coeruleus]
MEDVILEEIGKIDVAKPKKVINRAQLNEATLMNETKGLKRLYTEFQKFAIIGNSKNDLKKLMNIYKEWHFITAPKFEFRYFIEKCQILGTKTPIRSFMTRMRKVHKGELTWEDINNPPEIKSSEEIEENFYQNEENLHLNHGFTENKSQETITKKLKTPSETQIDDQNYDELNYLHELEEENYNENNEVNEDEEAFLDELGIAYEDTIRPASNDFASEKKRKF